MNIDWDNAPGGATHYKVGGDDPHWYDLRSQKFWAPVLSVWMNSDLVKQGEIDWTDFVPRPTKPAASEWDGEGYAEPGQKVSYNNGQYFEESEVLARKDCWLWLDVPSVGLVTVQQVLGLVSPIRTKEQRRRDELEYLMRGDSEFFIPDWVRLKVADRILAKYQLKERD